MLKLCHQPVLCTHRLLPRAGYGIVLTTQDTLCRRVTDEIFRSLYIIPVIIIFLQNMRHAVSSSMLITITDENGCVTVDSISLVQPAPLELSATTVTKALGSKNIDLTVSGGTPPYFYDWHLKPFRRCHKGKIRSTGQMCHVRGAN